MWLTFQIYTIVISSGKHFPLYSSEQSIHRLKPKTINLLLARDIACAISDIFANAESIELHAQFTAIKVCLQYMDRTELNLTATSRPSYMTRSLVSADRQASGHQRHD